tara:strand:+ start:143 stop:292 length:150 start_codon:yes stop_codon:yes gene_type:complete
LEVVVLEVNLQEVLVWELQEQIQFLAQSHQLVVEVVEVEQVFHQDVRQV